MADADSLARRRLNTILADEDYGPKLVRLSKRDQRVVLDLIQDNKGRDARRTILELDGMRRTKNRVMRYIRLAPQERIDDHPDEETPDFWDMYEEEMGM